MIERLIQTRCHYPLTKGEFFFINDDNLNNVPLFVQEADSWNLHVINKLDQIIHFVQNDGCIMFGDKSKKCDWICFFEKTFYFIEAKNVSRKQRGRQRNNAIEQFKVTIPYYLIIILKLKLCSSLLL